MLNLSNVLYGFSSSYKSCELRILAIEENGQLVNGVTSIFFSHKSPSKEKPTNLSAMENAFKKTVD